MRRRPPSSPIGQRAMPRFVGCLRHAALRRRAFVTTWRLPVVGSNRKRRACRRPQCPANRLPCITTRQLPAGPMVGYFRYRPQKAVAFREREGGPMPGMYWGVPQWLIALVLPMYLDLLLFIPCFVHLFKEALVFVFPFAIPQLSAGNMTRRSIFRPIQ